MLFFELIALSDEAHIDGGCFYTEQEPINQVKLACVITHFNRKQYLLPTLARFKNDLFNNADYNQKIKLIIVDNSQNIQADEAEGAIVIPNQNYGGSGGFMRGLLYAKDNNFTHCLFMDDDASFELDAIKRAYALMQYSTDKNLAIGGILLEDNHPYLVWEAGAQYINTPLTHHTIHNYQLTDARLIDNLLFLERENLPIHYQAWWFLLFNIDEMKHLSFPFYVRGDDILFSLQNQFKLITLNGISLFGANFRNKENVISRYLGFRAMAAIYLMMSEKCNVLAIMRQFSAWCFANLLSYNYSSAQAIYLALHDVLVNKTTTFSNDLNGEKLRNKLKHLVNKEKTTQFDFAILDIKYNHGKNTKINRMFRILTLNGFLLPSFLLKNDVVFQPKNFRAILKEIFLYKKVIYIDESNKTAYIAEHNKKEIFNGLVQWIKGLWLIFKEFNNAKQDFLAQKDYLTSEDFWREVYDLKTKSEDKK